MLSNSNASFQYSVKRVDDYVQILVQQSIWVGAFKLFVGLSRYFIDLRMPVVIQHEFL